MTDYVFAYGSLLNPSSLARTVPNARLDDFVGARLGGFMRTFDVAFPNDGSQGDKAYFDDDGHRPKHVLFANVVRTTGDQAANGILVPLGPGDLELLTDRERRYEIVDVTESIHILNPSDPAPDSVCAFVGRAQFTGTAEVGRGVLSREYLATIARGVRHWEQTYPGFAQDYHATTRLEPGTPILDLARVDMSTG